MWFTLEIFDCIHAKDFLDSFPNLRFGIIARKSVRGTVCSDKIFKGVRHFVIGFHMENRGEVGGASTEELEHCGATMAKDTVVVSRCIGKEGISCHGFVKTRNVSCRESGFIMLSEWVPSIHASELGGIVDRVFYTISRKVTKIGL